MSISIWQGEQVVKTTNATTTSMAKPDVAVLDNGQYVVTWVETLASGDSRILARVYNADGTAAGGEFQIASAASGSKLLTPAITGLANGDFAVVYLEGADGASELNSRIAVFQTDGTLVEYEIYTALSDADDAPDIIADGDGFIVTVSRAADTNPDNVFAARFEADGAGGYDFADQAVINDTSTAGDEAQSSIVRLANGNFAVAYKGTGDIFTRVVDSDFVPVSAETKIEDNMVATFAFGGPEVTALSNGGFVVTYAGQNSTDPFGNNFDVYARVLTPDGAPTGARIRVNVESAGQQANSIVTETNDGGFVILYSDGNTATIKGRVFDGFGTPQGGEFTLPVENLVNNEIESLDVDTLQDGRIIVTYESGLTSASDINTEINTLIFDPRGMTINGTQSGEIIYGSIFDNVIFGLGGDDDIQGLSGKDQIFGGTGDDTIDGGSEADVLEGGSGEDDIAGGSSNDRIFGDNGDDTLSGGTGNDTVRGGNDNDRVMGDSGADLLVGNDGGDTITGGSGDDRIFGGNDNDVIAGNDGDDDIAGGNGDDRMYGNDGDDTITGEDGDDEISGGSGDDLIFGRDGNDTLRGANQNDRILAGADDDIVAGNAGSDRIDGGSGDDRVFGGTGRDTLEGGAGTDFLAGGIGSDVFVFESETDSIHGNGRDTISDFTHNSDRIDLSDIMSGLDFIGGSSYSGTAGEVRYNSGIGRLYIDVDGDSASDFSVDVTGAPTIDAGDLIL